MTRQTRPYASRRVFLQSVAFASAATAASRLGWPVAGRAEEDLPGAAEHFVLLEWDSVPDSKAAGAVILKTDRGEFATFPAVQVDEVGEATAVGTAVVELEGCTAHSFAYSTDDERDERPRFYSELRTGAVFEVENSLWLQRRTEAGLGLVDGELSPKPLHHFCFTFNATTFHCIAEKLTLRVRSERFANIAADLAVRGLGD